MTSPVQESALLEVTGLEKSYEALPEAAPTVVLRGVDLRVAAGESVAIVGASGSGKSTLLQIIGTLDRPTAGSILLAGRNILALSDDELARLRSREIGFVFQSHHLLPQCTVLENVLIPALVSGGASKVEKRATDLLDRMGLSARVSHRPGQLSGGERQRVAVARALINGPRLLLADEPTGSLDRASAMSLTDLLVEMNRQEGVALIVVTHSASVAERMSRVLELQDGLLVEGGSE